MSEPPLTLSLIYMDIYVECRIWDSESETDLDGDGDATRVRQAAFVLRLNLSAYHPKQINATPRPCTLHPSHITLRRHWPRYCHVTFCMSNARLMKLLESQTAQNGGYT